MNVSDEFKIKKTKTKEGIDIIYSGKNHLPNNTYDSLYDELPNKENKFNILDFEGISESEICNYTREALRQLPKKDNILLGYPYEAIHSVYWNIVFDIVQTFDYKNILWIDGGTVGNGIFQWAHLRNIKIKHISSPVFFRILFRDGIIDSIPTAGNIGIRDKHFLSLGRLIRHERIYFTKKLINNPDIFKKGLVSCGWGKETLHLWEDETEIKEFFTKILTNEELKQFPISLQHQDNLQHMLMDEFKGAIFNVVQESSIGNDFRSHNLYYDEVSLRNINFSDRIFITEKTIKPFLMNQLPIFIAPPGMIKTLQNLKFDMFDDIIDHGYDKEDNIFKRCDMVFDELRRLVNGRTVKEWTDFLEENNIAERFIHNFNTVKELSSSTTIINWIHENF